MTRLGHSSLLQLVWKYAGAVSIRVKVLGIVLGVVLLLGTFVILQMQAVLGNTMIQDLEEQGIALANNIAQDASEILAKQDMTALRLLLFERKAHYSSETHNTLVAYIAIEDATGQIIASEGTVLALTGAVDHSHGAFHPVFRLNNGSIVEVHSSVPAANHLLRMAFSTQRIHQTVSQVTLQLLAITLVMVAVGFAAAFFLTWILTRPILDLVSATHAVTRGDFSRRVVRWADDEIGELATAFNGMMVSLQQAEQERLDKERLREEYISGIILAQENERQRIARELHDSTGQSLTSLLVGLQNLKQSKDSAEIDCRVDELRGVIGSALDEVRHISASLRPAALDDLGLISALNHYIQDYQTRHQLPVELVAHGLEKRLPSDFETTIYRIVQEGLTNIARHAQAKTISVIITCKNEVLKIIIEDDGVGFNPSMRQERKSLGLQGIRERAALLGGTLTIESQSGQGTSLFIEMPCVPLAKEQPHE